MTKETRKMDMDFYYINHGQVDKEELDDKVKKRKEKEREKRLKANKANREKSFDWETETVIQMTNKNKIKKEEERKRKLSQEEKTKKIRNKKIMIILKIVLILGTLIGSITFAMISPVFNIKDIEVINNEHVSSQTITSLSEIKIEENIFRFSSRDAICKIKENPYIKTVKIHRKYPSTIQIEVEERKHSYSMDFLGKYAYLDKQGYILEINEDSLKKPIIQGSETSEEQIVEGNRLAKEDLEKLEDVIKIMNATKEYQLNDKVTSIDISNKNEYSIYLEGEKKKVYLGDNTNLSNKMLYVNAILKEEKGKTGEIYANGDLNNKFRVYFRESLNV